MIINILKNSFNKIPQLYIYVLPLTILRIVPYEWESEMSMIGYLLLFSLIIIGFVSGYYQNYLSSRSYKKELKVNNLYRNFKKNFICWTKTQLLILFKILKWLIPIIITFSTATMLFNTEYHIITNLIGVVLLGLGTFFLYKLIILLIKVSMAGLIAVEKDKPTKEILEISTKITKDKKLFLAKIGILTAAISACISLLAVYLIFFLALGFNEIKELSLTGITSTQLLGLIIYLLIENIVSTLTVNVHGLVYKNIK